MTIRIKSARMNTNRQLLFVTLAAATCASLALALAPAARAADASPWVDDMHSALRLIAGSNKAGAGTQHAGIEIKLGPGWHTYWRYPGDSGVPPRFSFPGSDNVASVKVLYPAPHAFTDEAGTTIGYKDHVIFPLHVVPKDKSKPVTLHLKADYAVCEKLCVPVTASATLALDESTSANNDALAKAEIKVPMPVSASQAGLTVKRVAGGPKPMVAVDLTAQRGEPVQLFVEGPSPEWALPIPKPAPGAPAGHQYFHFVLDGLPPGVDPNGHFELTFTIERGHQPIEVKSRLD
jgi:DsbC/DsbD-like thiol-disulfide interchange protein